MKKLLCCLICLLLIVPSALADTKPVKLAEDDPLYLSLRETSLKLAGLFDTALRTDGYLSLFTTENLSQIENLLKMQDFTQPLSVTVVRADWPVNYSPVYEIIPRASFPPELEHVIRQKVYLSIGTSLASRLGAETLALASLYSMTDAFLRPEGMDGPCYAVLHYGGLYALLVTFVPNDNGAMIATAVFIPSSTTDLLNIPAD